MKNPMLNAAFRTGLCYENMFGLVVAELLKDDESANKICLLLDWLYKVAFNDCTGQMNDIYEYSKFFESLEGYLNGEVDNWIFERGGNVKEINDLIVFFNDVANKVSERRDFSEDDMSGLDRFFETSMRKRFSFYHNTKFMELNKYIFDAITSDDTYNTDLNRFHEWLGSIGMCPTQFMINSPEWLFLRSLKEYVRVVNNKESFRVIDNKFNELVFDMRSVRWYAYTRSTSSNPICNPIWYSDIFITEQMDDILHNIRIISNEHRYLLYEYVAWLKERMKEDKGNE